MTDPRKRQDHRRRDTGSAAQRNWVFDLDNTLYPAECNLFREVDRRMSAFVADLFGVDSLEARRIQKRYFLEYGTTLKGLMERHGVDPHAFMDEVHDVDISAIQPDPDLAAILSELEGRKLVFTNASTAYAERILERLGIAQQFDGLYDIAAAGFEPKPSPASYVRFVDQFDVVPDQAVMIEDMARNLPPAADLGMTTVWLRTSYEWGQVDHDPAGIHYEIDDLVTYLTEQTGKPGR